jgi:hypothetical protein
VATSLLIQLQLSACTPTWREIVSVDGGFRVLLPGDPMEESSTLETPCGRQEMKSFSVFLNRSFRFASRGFYYVTYAAINPSCKDREVEWVLDQERSAVVNGLGARLIGERQISHPYIGRELRMHDKDGNLIMARVYFVNGRIYHLGVGGRREAETHDGQRFLESFEVL